VPYLSWKEGETLRRHRLTGPCTLGRDPVACEVSNALDASVSHVHAGLSLEGGRWEIRDLGSRNGTYLNGAATGSLGGTRLSEGDRLVLGDWVVTYTEGFPGLDGEAFVEAVGELFEEVQPEGPQGRLLLRGLELLQRSTAALLREGSLGTLMCSVLEEALSLLGADRGFLVRMTAPGVWQVVHRVGDVQEAIGLSHSVLAYVADRRTGVLSNAPLMDPRFGGASLVELHRGALMCAPLTHDEEILGMVYVDRAEEDQPFSRFDLALFQSFVRLAGVILRHVQLAQRALGQAEAQGEQLRLKALHERLVLRTGEILGAMQGSLRWLQSYGEKAHGELAEALRDQVARLQHLTESGIQEALLETPREASQDCSLSALQGQLEPIWQRLLRVRGAALQLEPPPALNSWIPSALAAQVLAGLVEPLLMRVSEAARVSGDWREDGGASVLRLVFPPGIHGPVPDPWTQRMLRETGIQWRWIDQTLVLTLPQGLQHTPEAPTWPLLGLVGGSTELLGLLESVAQAGELEVQTLEAEPPQGPLPTYKFLVLDAQGVSDPLGTLQAYRRHPIFGAAPILVVRASEEMIPSLLASGATDWLPEGFRWETLHHRLQVLKGHDELQRKALAAERLDSFRQMAGTLKHEINNPLAVISMQIELLQRKYPEEAKFAKVDEMIERIRGLMQVLQKMREAPVEDYPGGTSILKLS